MAKKSVLDKNELRQRIKEIPLKKRTLVVVMAIIKKWEADVHAEYKKIERTAKSHPVDRSVHS